MTKEISFTAQVIKVANKKATIPARPGSKIFKRYTILLTLDGKTVQDYAVTKGLIELVAPKA